MDKTLLFFDLDGTIAANDEFNHCVVSERNLEALELLKDKDCFLVACTGRQAVFVERLLPGVFDAVIANCGNYILCGDKVIFRNSIPLRYLKEFKDIFKRNRITSAAVGIIDVYVLYYEEADLDRIVSNYDPGCRIHYVEDIDDKEVFIFDLFFHNPEEYLRIRQYFNDDMIVNIHDDITLPTDISFIQNKGTAAKILLDYLGGNYITYGIGDGHNDIPLIEMCDVGIAMSTGVEEIKEVADYISDNKNNCGVYSALKHFGLI